VYFLEKINRKELYNLSNQFIELFITDIFSKNQVNLKEAKERMTDEQREKLKQTVENLKEEVEGFLDASGKKTVNEEEQETKEKMESSRPLREKFINKKETKKKENEDKE